MTSPTVERLIKELAKELVKELRREEAAQNALQSRAIIREFTPEQRRAIAEVVEDVCDRAIAPPEWKTIKQLAKESGQSTRKIWNGIRNRSFKSRLDGKRRMIHVPSWNHYIDSCPEERLDTEAQTTENSDPVEHWISVREASKRFSMMCRHIYEMIQENKIEEVFDGKRKTVNFYSLRTYLQNQEQLSRDGKPVDDCAKEWVEERRQYGPSPW